METEQFDAAVIGSGQAGGPLARAFAQAGWKTVLVEGQHVGGSCINEGCTPTKTMVASARVAYLARRASDYGVQAGPVSVSMARVRERKRGMVESFRAGSERRIVNDGVHLWMGQASFSGPHSLRVQMNDGSLRELQADRIFINTGAHPATPPLPGLDRVPWLDSTTIMELDTLPEHLLILGGGYVGVEFGQMFRRFGSAVTLVQRGDQLLAREDDDVAGEVLKILREDGLSVWLDTEAARVEPTPDGHIALTVRTPEGQRQLVGSHLLVATGRAPTVEALNLAAAGVETDRRGAVRVNEKLETNVPGVWALGDVNGGPAFTHMSYDDYRIVRANVLEGGHATTFGRLVPYVVFMDPQLGRVGLTERQARAEGRNIRVGKMPMEYVARADEVGEARGLMKAIVDADSGQILGCAMLGIEGGELMAMIEIAMLGRVPYTTLRDGIFAHPTLAESLNNLFAASD
jgi:pyruvate/2-oxoglutarate dehydrogenase complex dihydrolipoamide dehydrogenase (E3) component